jgi:hypothetical protein
VTAIALFPPSTKMPNKSTARPAAAHRMPYNAPTTRLGRWDYPCPIAPLALANHWEKVSQKWYSAILSDFFYGNRKCTKPFICKAFVLVPRLGLEPRTN